MDSSEISSQPSLAAWTPPQSLQNDNSGQESNLLNGSSKDPVFEDNTENVDRWQPEGSIVFEVHNVSQLSAEMKYSPSVYIRNLPWRLMVCVKECTGEPDSKHLSIFVQCTEGTKMAWSCDSYVILEVVPFEKKSSHREDFEHIFTALEDTWGFPYFMLFAKLLDPTEKYILNDSIILRAHIKADQPHGIAFDPKSTTGFVGLENLGTTCYINSLLQTLYFTNEFRRAVYMIPTERDDVDQSLAFNLQSIFYKMQTSTKAVGTLKFVNSLNLESMDVVAQHDIHEFLRLFIEKLESRMVDTCVEAAIPSLFQGETCSSLRCKDIDLNSYSTEIYYDIQLKVRNNKDIYQALNNYTEVEMLDGDNKYDAGPCGLQRAEKHFSFVSFPPMLYLHLLRIEYDAIQKRNVKIIDRFEFSDVIQLDPYLLEPEATPAYYKLHTVLAHVGLEAQSGHYVAYISPEANEIWYKFDDEKVSRVSKVEAITQNYGGNNLGIHTSCAYMLVYIRMSAVPNILREVCEYDIPPALLTRLTDEAVNANCNSEAIEEGTIAVKIFLEDSLEQHQLGDLFDWEKAQYRVFTVRLSQTVKALCNRIRASFQMGSQGRFRLWPVSVRMNMTRPMFLDKELECYTPISSIVGIQDSLTIFLQLASPETRDLLPPFDPYQHRLVFFKLFNANRKRLTYLGLGQYSVYQTLADLIHYVNEQLGHPLEFRDYFVYEEVCLHKIEKLTNWNDYLGDVLRNPGPGMCGNIIIFEEVKCKDESPGIEKLYEIMPHIVEIKFLNKANENSFILECYKRDSYREMATKVASVLGCSPKRIQFFSVKDSAPFQTFSYSAVLHWNVEKLLSCNRPKLSKLFYEELSTDIEAVKVKKYSILWLSPTFRQKEYTVFVDEEGTVQTLREELQNHLRLEGVSDKTLRILTVKDFKILKIHKDNVPLELFPNIPVTPHTHHRVEEIPDDQLKIDRDEMLVPVFHFSQETSLEFGRPFLLLIKRGETFGRIKMRITNYLLAAKFVILWENVVIVTENQVYYVAHDSIPVNLYNFYDPHPFGKPPSIGLQYP